MGGKVIIWLTLHFFHFQFEMQFYLITYHMVLLLERAEVTVCHQRILSL